MGDNEPANVDELIATLSAGAPPEGKGDIVRFTHKGSLATDAAKLEQLCAALRGNKWCEQLHFRGTNFTGAKAWPSILAACCEMATLFALYLDDCSLDAAAGVALARALGEHRPPALEHLMLPGNALGEMAIEQLAEAARGLPKALGNFLLAAEAAVPLTERAIVALVALRERNGAVAFGAGPAGRAVEARVAMASIQNATARKAVQRKQRELRAAFASGDAPLLAREAKALREIATPEAARLLGLLPKLADKYALVGGFALLFLLPADFKNEAAVHDVSKSVAARSLEDGVRFCLAEAVDRRRVLTTELVPAVLEVLEMLAKGCNHPSLVEVVVDKVLADCGLKDAQLKVPGYAVKCDDARVKQSIGEYAFHGHCNGRPCWRRSAPNERFLYYDAGQNMWRVSDVLGDSGCYMVLADADGIAPTASGGAWAYGDSSALDPPAQLTETSDGGAATLRAALVDFLTRRLDAASGLPELLALDADHVVVYKEGPAKSLARALDKVRAPSSKRGPRPKGRLALTLTLTFTLSLALSLALTLTLTLTLSLTQTLSLTLALTPTRCAPSRRKPRPRARPSRAPTRSRISTAARLSSTRPRCAHPRG
eukprot:scaffold67725_cov69-Phaeocystis_antarctica.AAC.1